MEKTIPWAGMEYPGRLAAGGGPREEKQRRARRDDNGDGDGDDMDVFVVFVATDFATGWIVTIRNMMKDSIKLLNSTSNEID